MSIGLIITLATFVLSILGTGVALVWRMATLTTRIEIAIKSQKDDSNDLRTKMSALDEIRPLVQRVGQLEALFSTLRAEVVTLRAEVVELRVFVASLDGKKASRDDLIAVRGSRPDIGGGG